MQASVARRHWVRLALAVFGVTLTIVGVAGVGYRSTEATGLAAPAIAQISAPLTSNSPVVAVTAPLPGVTVHDSVIVSATASDPAGILKVRFWVDGLYLGYDLAAPYTKIWDSRLSVNGIRTLTVQAVNNSGATTTVSQYATVANTDGVPPAVSFAAPAAGATVAGNIQIQALATDNVAIQKVRFWVDGTYLGYELAAPYTKIWSTSLFSNGAHVLKSEALDNVNNSSITTRFVTVANGTVTSTSTATPTSTATTTSTSTSTPTPTPTLTATPTPSTTPTPTASTSNLPVPWIGVNNWALASASDVNGICGNSSQLALDSKMTTLKAAGVDVIRFAAYQSYAIDGSHQRNWLAFDRVFASASAHGIHLIPILGNNWVDCDYWGANPGSTSRDAGTPVECGGSGSWYDVSGAPGSVGNYRSPYAGYITGYRQWVDDFVTRYHAQSSIITWEILNEPWETCAHSFFVDITNLIRSVDPVTPIGLGGNPNGWSPDDQKLPNVNVLTAHDYAHVTTLLPSVVSQGLSLAKSIGKPFYVGEAGIDCNNDHIGCPAGCTVSPCASGTCDEAARIPYLNAKISAAFGAGASGYLLWAYSQTQAPGSCSYDFGPPSPLLGIASAY
jgi:Bacterial Ig domain/Cellulase (glycosyl hydrolase family 5)